MCFGKGNKQVNHSFGTCQGKRIFPLYHPLTLMGHTFLPIRGAPHRGPGYNIMEDTCGLAYNLTKIPTSKKGYSCGARTTMRFKPLNKDVTPDPGKYQSIQDRKYKPNFAPFNVLVPRFRTFAKKNTYPGPGTYSPEIKSPSKITWPMKFGSPDWTQVPQLQRRTLKTELPTDKEFRKHRNRMAYLCMYYN
ncbi:protein pitchfork [Suncus etruscus]|uniref:protein pitchfork n=1 Tax=Suncus etruscus TaxID=109475 RepID=UPI00210F92DC|nr:protein pitchfork [Suncus etruscus]